MAYVIPKGHKIRIAISTAYWPLIWPTADNATLTVYPQYSSITLPVNAQPICSKSVPEHNKTVSFNGKILRPSDSKRVTHRDYKTGVVTLETMEDFGRQFYESSQSEIDFIIHQELSIHPDDPLSAKNDIRLKVDMGREGWWTGIECHYEMICDHDYFYITANWKAFYDNDVVFEKQFTETIKRHFM